MTGLILTLIAGLLIRIGRPGLLTRRQVLPHRALPPVDSNSNEYPLNCAAQLSIPPRGLDGTTSLFGFFD